MKLPFGIKAFAIVLVALSALPLIVGAAAVVASWTPPAREPLTTPITVEECLEAEYEARTGETNTTAAMEELEVEDPFEVAVIEAKCQNIAGTAILELQGQQEDTDRLHQTRLAHLDNAWTFLTVAAFIVGIGVASAVALWAFARE